MTFETWYFLATMATVTTVFWSVPAKFRFYALSVMTALVLGYWDWTSLIMLAVMTLLTIRAAAQSEMSGRDTCLYLFAIFGLLLTFKGLSNPDLLEGVAVFALPLGISYYALRCAHVVLERYKGTLAATPSPQLVHYLFFLPVLVVGPIHRLPQFTRDIRRHRWDANMFVEGIERIIIGYAKVALLAAFLVNLLDTAFTLYIDDSTPGLQTYTEMILIGISLYFTFSGYSDVAIGFARLLGFRVMENFDSPYLKPNISAFWASWHISLTSWSREYVYNSVVSITRSPGLAAMASLVVIGLWHDISWQYLLWGLYHGSAIFVWQRFQKVKLYLPAFQNILLLGGLHILSVLMTIHFVFLGFLLVRQEKFGDIIYHIKALIGISI